MFFKILFHLLMQNFFPLMVVCAFFASAFNIFLFTNKVTLEN